MIEYILFGILFLSVLFIYNKQKRFFNGYMKGFNYLQYRINEIEKYLEEQNDKDNIR